MALPGLHQAGLREPVVGLAPQDLPDGGAYPVGIALCRHNGVTVAAIRVVSGQDRQWFPPSVVVQTTEPHEGWLHRMEVPAAVHGATLLQSDLSIIPGFPDGEGSGVVRV